MAAYRDHPRTGGAHIAQVVYLTATSVAAGSGAVFILVLIVGLVSDEALGTFGDAFDPIFRASIGFVALVLAAALGVAAFALAFRRTATAEQLAEAAQRQPDEVATWSDRRDIEVEGGSPFTVVSIFGGFFVGLDALAILIFIPALDETVRYNPESAAVAVPILLAMVTLGVITVLLMIYVRKTLLRRWRDAAGTVETVWNEPVRSRASASEKAARPHVERVDFGKFHGILTVIARRLGRAALPAAGVGFALFMIGVWTRQPCRACDQRFFDRPIESFIDVVVLIGGPLMILAALIGVLGLIAAWVARIIELTTLRSLAADGGPSPKPAQLLTHLIGAGPAELLGIALIAASLPLIAPFAAARVVDGSAVWATVVLVLAAVGAVGVLVLAWSVPADDAMRNRLRAAWSPGDPMPVVSVRGRRSGSVRDAGDVSG